MKSLEPNENSRSKNSRIKEKSSEWRVFNDDDLLNNDVRMKYVNLHPFFTEHIIKTTTISDFCDLVRKVVLVREQGCCFTARSGAGKTIALRALKQYLLENFPELVVHVYDTQNRQVPSVRAFFQHVLDAVHSFEMKGETYLLRMRLRNRLVDEARRAGMNVILLLVDEAQAMDIKDFQFLKDIDNAVRNENVQFITILMGQAPEFSAKQDEFISDRHLDLVGRFMMRMMAFPSLSTLEDIQTILEEMDNLIYPKESTWTWTQFFFPRAWANGFRMRNEAGNFFNALTGMPNETRASYEFPARQTFLALRSFVVDNACYDKADMMLPPKAWDDAVVYAQLFLASKLSGSLNNGDEKVGI